MKENKDTLKEKNEFAKNNNDNNDDDGIKEEKIGFIIGATLGILLSSGAISFILKLFIGLFIDIHFAIIYISVLLFSMKFYIPVIKSELEKIGKK